MEALPVQENPSRMFFCLPLDSSWVGMVLQSRGCELSIKKSESHQRPNGNSRSEARLVRSSLHGRIWGQEKALWAPSTKRNGVAGMLERTLMGVWAMGLCDLSPVFPEQFISGCFQPLRHMWVGEESRAWELKASGSQLQSLNQSFQPSFCFLFKEGERQWTLPPCSVSATS